MIVDGVETKDCPDCQGDGETYCECCGHADGECEMCKGSGQVPVEKARKRKSQNRG